MARHSMAGTAFRMGLAAALAAGGASAGAAEGRGAADGKIAFPDVKGFKKSAERRFEDPALGYSVGYSGENVRLTVTIYVYDGGRKNIGDGIESEVVKGELDRTEADIRAYADMGNYKNVERKADSKTTLGGGKVGIPVLRRDFEYEADGRKLASRILLTGRGGRFFKVRATGDVDAREAVEKELGRVLAELEKSLGK